VSWRHQKRIENSLCLRSDEHDALAAMMLSLVGRHVVAPCLASHVEVAGAQCHDFTRPHPSPQLESNHCPDLCGYMSADSHNVSQWGGTDRRHCSGLSATCFETVNCLDCCHHVGWHEFLANTPAKKPAQPARVLIDSLSAFPSLDHRFSYWLEPKRTEIAGMRIAMSQNDESQCRPNASLLTRGTAVLDVMLPYMGIVQERELSDRDVGGGKARRATNLPSSHSLTVSAFGLVRAVATEVEMLPVDYDAGLSGGPVTAVLWHAIVWQVLHSPKPVLVGFW
jgi:hypothetical protein